ncbi:UNVERIFIED_CONTAM: hypothetical protein Sradi_0513200 [Sesamum radiatum]|uniref:Transposase MuDR plant domain-containing protein n=1 Tax=Sesamum radiatum TaxID=300843 RepID=A0AAW2VI59_SESRA
MYDQCGGKKSMLKFYYKNPTLPLEWGIRPIKEDCPDICMVDLQNCHRDFDVPVNIYVEEDEVEPLVAIDSQGNPIEKEQEEEIRHLLDGIDFEELDGDGNEIEGDRRKDFQQNDSNMTENLTENFTEIPVQNMPDKGKRKLYERFLNESSSEFDDSSDEDYVQSNEGSDSDAPSLVYQDIECESDDDIFLSKDPSKKELIMKLKRVLKDKKNRNIPETRETESGDHGWASEAENEDDLVSLEGSEGSDCEKHPVYKESSSMKNLKLVAGMKFENAAQFRVVLRDWCIRNGVDLEFLRNEAARVTAKCKVKGCEWRIHASLVLGGPTFQIKTIKVYGGQLLVAVGRDGNDNMFPIAMAVVQVENRDSWGWFVGELLDDIGGLGTSKWSFISDRQKGLVEALKDLVPDSEHRFCVRHMYENFKMKWKSVELKEYFWKAASTANKREFENFMKKIEELDPKIKPDVETASEWLKKISPEHWARSHFPVHSKCDILVNNLCESFNNYILEARDKPIISMIEWIRTRLMSSHWVKRARLEDYVDDFYTKAVYLKVYTEMIHAVPGANEAVHAEIPQVAARKRDNQLHQEVQPRGSQMLVFMRKSHRDLKLPPPPHLEPGATKCRGCSRGRIPNPEAAQPPTESSATQQQIGYQGPRNASLLGKNPATSSIPTTRRYNKRPSISEVLDKMKERQKRRQQD